MSKSFSIAEARHNLAAVVHQLEHQPQVELTRRGKPVAMLLSVREYNRLTTKQDFWSAYLRFTEAVDLPSLEIGPDVFEKVRDQSRGREVSW